MLCDAVVSSKTMILLHWNVLTCFTIVMCKPHRPVAVIHQAAGMQQYLHEQPELISELHLRTMKIWKRYSVGQSPKVAAHAVEWRRVLGLARSYREAACVKMRNNLEIISDKKKRVEAAHAHLHDVRRHNIIENSARTNERLARSARQLLAIRTCDGDVGGVARGVVRMRTGVYFSASLDGRAHSSVPRLSRRPEVKMQSAPLRVFVVVFLPVLSVSGLQCLLPGSL